MSRAEQIVKEVVPSLMEHWDTVQIFVSRVDEKGATEAFAFGAGNWWARCGMVAHFQTKAEEDGRVEYREQHQRQDEELDD